MVQELPRRTGFSGPALIRLLARLTDATVCEPGQTLPNRLSLWLAWADAIALSGALSGVPPTVAASAGTGDVAGQAEFDRVRVALQAAISGTRASTTPRQRAQQRPAVKSEAGAPPRIDYALYRQRYVSLQQSMETSIINLRTHLRTLLAAQSSKMAKLAVVDAAMEQALGGQEQRLLASVPGLLEKRFEQLRQDGQTDGQDTLPGKPAAWLDIFQQDMQRVLLAELDIRLQPVEGLLAALRTR